MRFLPLILLICLVLSSCALVDVGENIGEKAGEALIPSSEADALRQTCEIRAKELFPTTVRLEETSNWYLKSVTWANNLSSDTSIRYRMGEKEGENVNYYYASNVIEENYVRYTEQLVSEGGTIVGDRDFKVKFTLEPVIDTADVAYDDKFDREITTQLFRIVDYEFKTCDWLADG